MALVFKADPHVPSLLKEMYIMGGNTEGMGNREGRKNSYNLTSSQTVQACKRMDYKAGFTVESLDLKLISEGHGRVS